MQTFPNKDHAPNDANNHGNWCLVRGSQGQARLDELLARSFHPQDTLPGK